uniref:Uncharacterized protein n=1 Tax=Promethearchaeum syntrophicum TaxID=2594042 RepID=A0A5B9DAZ5_9ARCH|nr:hypothetical protein DSAG12_01747 [Candidatus Prometheoarchaeum syntrophicum]
MDFTIRAIVFRTFRQNSKKQHLNTTISLDSLIKK